MKEIDPINTNWAASWQLYIDAPMPMITIFKTLDIPNLNSRRQRLGQILLCSITGRSPMR